MKTHPFLTVAALAGLFSLLSGCGTLVPQDDPTQYYLLKAVSAERIASKSGISAGIGPVTIPGYLEHKEIVTAGPANDLTLADFHVWAEPFEKAVARVVAKNVSQLVDSPSVVPFPDADIKQDFNASIIIRRFEMRAGGVVQLEASYDIQGAGGIDRGGLARSKSVSVRVADPKNYGAIADAMSQALAELSKSIARDLLRVAR